MSASEYDLDRTYSTEEAHGYTVFEFEDESMAEHVIDEYHEENSLYQLNLFGITAEMKRNHFGAVQVEEKIVADSGEKDQIENIADRAYREVID